MGPEPREGGNDLTQRQILHHTDSALPHRLQALGGGCRGFRVLHIHGGGADDGIAVHRGRHQHALAVFARQVEDGMAYGMGLFIQQHIVSPAGKDGHGVFGHHVMQHSAVNACGIDHGAGLIGAFFGLHRPAAGDPADMGHLFVETELRSVFAGILRQRDIQPEGADNGAGGRPERSHSLSGSIGLQRKKRLPVQNLQPLYPVGNPSLVEPLQVGLLRFTEAQHDGAAALIGKVQLFRQAFHPAAARHVQLCHQSAGFRVEAGVDDGGIGLTGAAAHVLLLIQHQNVRLIAAQFPCAGAAGYTGADDDYIFHPGCLLFDPAVLPDYRGAVGDSSSV